MQGATFPEGTPNSWGPSGRKALTTHPPKTGPWYPPGTPTQKYGAPHPERLRRRSRPTRKHLRRRKPLRQKGPVRQAAPLSASFRPAIEARLPTRSPDHRHNNSPRAPKPTALPRAQNLVTVHKPSNAPFAGRTNPLSLFPGGRQRNPPNPLTARPRPVDLPDRIGPLQRPAPPNRLGVSTWIEGVWVWGRYHGARSVKGFRTYGTKSGRALRGSGSPNPTWRIIAR